MEFFFPLCGDMCWLGKIIKSHLAVFLIATGAFLASCSKSEDPILKESLIGFDPAVQKEEVNRILQLKGSYLENTPLPSKSLPKRISGFGLSAVVEPPALFFRDELINPSSMDTMEIGNEIEAQIPVTLSGFQNPILYSYFIPVNLYFKVSGAKGRWKIPAPKNADGIVGGGGTASLSISVPALVREGNFMITVCAELACNLPGFDTVRLFTDTVNALFSIRPPIPCGGDSILGKAGLTIRKIDFGPQAKAGMVKVRFRTGGLADRLDIRFGGKFVVSTCANGLPSPGSYPRCSNTDCWKLTYENWEDYAFYFDPAKGRFAEFLILGFCGNSETKWGLDVDCPE